LLKPSLAAERAPGPVAVPSCLLGPTCPCSDWLRGMSYSGCLYLLISQASESRLRNRLAEFLNLSEVEDRRLLEVSVGESLLDLRVDLSVDLPRDLSTDLPLDLPRDLSPRIVAPSSASWLESRSDLSRPNQDMSSVGRVYSVRSNDKFGFALQGKVWSVGLVYREAFDVVAVADDV
jgi:hypothetical protein